MILRIKITTLTPVLLVLLLGEACEACHYLDGNPYRNFGVFTDYQSAKLSLAKYAIDNSPQVMSLDCSVLSYWQFSREGASLPAYGIVDPSTTEALLFLKSMIIESHQLGRGLLCPEDLSALVNWGGHPVQVLEAEEELSNVGAKDMFSISRRYSHAFFGDLFDFTPGNFRVVYSPSEASYSSALSIVYGMAPVSLQHAVSPQLYLKENDDLTQYKCRLTSEVFIGADAYEESVLDAVAGQVRARLGLRGDLFTKEHLHWTYDACRSAIAVNPVAYSPWCAIFSKDDLAALELVEDSVWYRRLGLKKVHYHEMVNYELMPVCRTLRHLLEYFRSLVEDIHFNNHQVSTARVVVGDVSALLRLLAVMGVNAEASPVSVDSEWMLNNRRWRTSEMAPFGGHLVLALTRCHGQEFFVRAYLQEIPFTIMNCPVNCPWLIFEKNLETIMSYCPDILHCPSDAHQLHEANIGLLILTFLSVVVVFLLRS